MKIRTGFVSNSSASSFIISYDPDEINITGLLEYNRKYSESHARVNYIGIKDIVEHFKTWYDFDFKISHEIGYTDEEAMDSYRKEFAAFAANVAVVADEVNAGREVAYITISYNNNDKLEELHGIDGIKFVKDFS